MRNAPLLFVTLAWLTACGGTGELFTTNGGDASLADVPTVLPDGGAVGRGLPCDVDRVLGTQCRGCHGDPTQFGAPMPLTSFETLQSSSKSTPSKKVYELVGARVHDDARPMPPPPNARLSAADTKVLDDWISKGGSRDDASCAGVTSDAGIDPLSCTPDQVIAPATKWTMPQDTTDVYVCYGVDLTSTSKRHIVAIAPNVDNAAIVHHVLLFQSDTPVSPTPAPCSGGGSLTNRMMFGWAPGGKNMDLPPQAGFPQEGTTHYVVQVHYSNLRGLAGQTDGSGFKVCTGAPRQFDADVMAFGTQTIQIAAGQTLTKKCSVRVQSQFAGLTLFAAMPHMHQLGTSISTKLLPAGNGAPVDLGTVANWNFQNQAWSQISGGTLALNDAIETTCTWRNTTNAPVRFGEKTSDEMCYSFTMYYPKVTAGFWSWALPAIIATCQ